MPKTRAPEQTLEEPKYLRRLIEGGVRVGLKLSNDEVLEGKVEFYDENFIRLTRADEPNVFVYKHDIKYLYEIPE